MLFSCSLLTAESVIYLPKLVLQPFVEWYCISVNCYHNAFVIMYSETVWVVCVLVQRFWHILVVRKLHKLCGNCFNFLIFKVDVLVNNFILCKNGFIYLLTCLRIGWQSWDIFYSVEYRVLSVLSCNLFSYVFATEAFWSRSSPSFWSNFLIRMC